MGSEMPVVLGFLCLILGALLTGEAVEQSSIQTPELLTELPMILEALSSSEDPESVQSVTRNPSPSELVNATLGPQINESTPVVEDPVSDVLFTNHVGETDSATVTAASQEAFNGSEASVSNPGGTVSVQDTMEDEQTDPVLTASTPAILTTGNSLAGQPSLFTTLGLPLVQSQSDTEPLAETIEPATTTATTWMAAITTSLVITTTMAATHPSVPATHPSVPATQSTTLYHTTRAEVQRRPSVLDVGDDESEVPSYYSTNSSNPLFVMIVSIFTIMVVMVVVVVGFQRYKRRNNRTEFRRLQDLPMDDMMEDTPLSLYSY